MLKLLANMSEGTEDRSSRLLDPLLTTARSNASALINFGYVSIRISQTIEIFSNGKWVIMYKKL